MEEETPQLEYVDWLAGKTLEFNVLDHGKVRLIDLMPRLVPVGQTPDYAILQAARVSYGVGTKSVREDRALIRHLLRNRHMSPFEMVELKFHLKLPIFVMRQLVRHRTANLNEYSARYSVMKDEFYVPIEEQIRLQSKTNKQGRGDLAQADIAKEILEKYSDISAECYAVYEALLGHDLARELARGILPVNYYTECYWKMDLRNLLGFLVLRDDPGHAQYEILVYAQIIDQLVQMCCPVVHEAYVDYMKESMLLSRMEKNFFTDTVQGIKDLKRYLEGNTGEKLSGYSAADLRDMVYYIESRLGALLATEEGLENKYGLSKREAKEFLGKLG